MNSDALPLANRLKAVAGIVPSTWRAWRSHGWLYTLTRLAWAFFFLSLPVTSFPYLPEELGGRTLVRPLAIYPLLVLLLLVTLPRLWRKPLPRTFLPLLAFVLAAMIGSLLSFTSDLNAYRGVSLAARFVRSLLTLGLGVAFYLTVTLLHETWEDLRFSLRWLLAGMGVALAWGTLQIPYVVFYQGWYFKAFTRLQGLVSSRKLFNTRISGMTYEPKWFAEQIVFLLLPWLLAYTLKRRSLFAWRLHLGRFTFTSENLMLPWAVGVLFFTYSRTGLFILGGLVVVCFWVFRYQTHKKHVSLAPPPPRPLRRRVLETAVIVVGVLAVLFVVGSQNAYFSRLWRYWTDGKARNRSYLEFIAFEQRFVYWATALRIYAEQPLVGVGLGNYAFYFADRLPNQPYETQKEIMRQITPGEGRDRLITPKNLYARLIAETGLLGVGLFTVFLLGVVGCLLYVGFSPGQEQATFALGAGLALLVFVVVTFSFDSFALPNMWVIFGLVTAAAHLPDEETSA